MFSAVVAMSKNDDIYFGVARWNAQKDDWTYYVETEVSGHSKCLGRIIIRTLSRKDFQTKHVFHNLLIKQCSDEVISSFSFSKGQGEGVFL